MAVTPICYDWHMGNLAEDTRWMDATDQAALIRSGQVSALELVEAAMGRIETFDGPINSVVLRWFEHARRLAASDALPDGPFSGVPFLLKDLGASAIGLPMSSGNQALAENPPLGTFDTELVARFKRTGLVTLGRTASCEMGSLPVTEPLAYGPTRNPWDLDRTPGGSSGGSAAAVAAGLVPFAHASDGGGSIRIPASCCGLVGLKPSQGRISLGPNKSEAGLTVELCVSRSVRDTAALLEAVKGPGIGDTVIAPKSGSYLDALNQPVAPLRIGLMDVHPRGEPLDPECAEGARSVARMLEAMGHHVEPTWPTVLSDNSFIRKFMAIWSVGAALSLASYAEMLGRPLTEEEVEPVNWAQAEFARKMSGVDYAQALAAVADFRRSCLSWWNQGWDLLITPTVAEIPPLIGEHDHVPGDPMAPMKRAAKWLGFTQPFNTTGQPAISLPLHRTATGLPVGVQIVADYGREDLLISVAAQLEAAHPWPHIV
jgi:amidase